MRQQCIPLCYKIRPKTWEEQFYPEIPLLITSIRHSSITAILRSWRRKYSSFWDFSGTVVIQYTRSSLSISASSAFSVSTEATEPVHQFRCQLELSKRRDCSRWLRSVPTGRRCCRHFGSVWHWVQPDDPAAKVFSSTADVFFQEDTMIADSLIPAAQYLRMSTEHQKYSLENQSAAIQKYAKARGFQIVSTYSDPAKSGLVLRRRFGLQHLLRDVVGTPPYRAILVYDVSRWGRFQDTDESAHYEFLCKAAGVPVHYCAESFVNDGSLPSLIMKTLKRTMAAEYSRDLSVKVLAGQKRIAHLGFKQGGVPGYGLRRMLVASDGTPKQLLASGERKSIATDRVTLVHGPAFEVARVREMYRLLISDRLSVPEIARQLNNEGVKQPGKGPVANPWNYATVYHVLTNPSMRVFTFLVEAHKSFVLQA